MLLCSITARTQSSSVLYAGSYFSAEQKLVSPDSIYTCIFQGDGNLVVYKNMQTSIWSTETAGKTITKCVLQFDGNLVLYSAGDVVEYNSGSAGGCFPPYWIQMQGDGNLVIYNGKSVAVWSSMNGLTNAEKKMDCPLKGTTSIGAVLMGGVKMTPGQKLVSPNGIYSCVLQGDGNLVVYEYGQTAIWNTQSTGMGVTHCVMQNDGNFVVYSNNIPKWHSQTFGGKYPPYWIQMQGDGNLVIYNNKIQAIWSSKLGPTNIESPPIIKRNPNASEYKFQTGIVYEGSCEQSGYEVFLVNNNFNRSYRVTVRVTTDLYNPPSRNSEDKTFNINAGERIKIGCTKRYSGGLDGYIFQIIGEQ